MNTDLPNIVFNNFYIGFRFLFSAKRFKLRVFRLLKGVCLCIEKEKTQSLEVLSL